MYSINHIAILLAIIIAPEFSRVIRPELMQFKELERHSHLYCCAFTEIRFCVCRSAGLSSPGYLHVEWWQFCSLTLRNAHDGKLRPRGSMVDAEIGLL